MRNKEIYIGFLLTIFLFSFNVNKKEGTVIISEANEGNSTYTLKCSKRINEENNLAYQYFLEVYSSIDPKNNFETSDEYANFVQFKLNELFKITLNGEKVKVFGSRLEQGITGTNVYRINIYFEKDTMKKIKNIEVDFEDRLFENKNIILTAKKVKL